MDPQSPAPEQPTPASSPEPTPTPAPQGQPPKRLSKGVLISIIGGILFAILLIITIVVTVRTMSGDDTSNSDTRNDSSSKTNSTDEENIETNPKATSITAKTLVELREACVGGSVENAAVLTKPYMYVVYENNNDGISEKEAYKWDMYAFGANDESIPVNENNPSEFNVVVCLDRDDSTAEKIGVCKVQAAADAKPSDPTVVDFLSVQYKVAFYEAQSGKLIDKVEPINGPATACPSTAYYNRDSPNLYGDPDMTELNARLQAFEQ